MPLCKPQPQVSLLIPFKEGNDPHRTLIWEWLEEFYSHTGFEIVMGTDDGFPFSKSTAVNNAALKARGKVFIIMDADCYTNPAVLQECADRILAAESAGKKLWFIPYLRLFRLTEEVTISLMATTPTKNFYMPDPLPADWTEVGADDHYGHKFGAMLLMMSAGAFWTAGGMDPRFRGWGSEDLSFMIAVDTLYGLHETVENNIYHMWHARPGANTIYRHWEGQRTHSMNIRLGQRYGIARGDQTFMKALTEEHYHPSWFVRFWRWFKKKVVNCFKRTD